jgi:hypothetical protein
MFLGNNAASIKVKKVGNIKKKLFLKTAINGLETRYRSGTGTGIVTCQKSEPEPDRNRNFSKVGTGTVKISYPYGSTTVAYKQVPVLRMFAWIRIELALLYPGSYWEAGIGFRSKEIQQS